MFANAAILGIRGSCGVRNRRVGMDEDLKQYLERKFAGIDGKFAAVNGKFGAIDDKFAALDGKFGAIDGKFAALDGKFGAIDGKFVELEAHIMDRVGGRIDAVEERMRDYVRQSVQVLKTEIITEF